MRHWLLNSRLKRRIRLPHAMKRSPRDRCDPTSGGCCREMRSTPCANGAVGDSRPAGDAGHRGAVRAGGGRHDAHNRLLYAPSAGHPGNRHEAGLPIRSLPGVAAVCDGVGPGRCHQRRAGVGPLGRHVPRHYRGRRLGRLRLAERHRLRAAATAGTARSDRPVDDVAGARVGAVAVGDDRRHRSRLLCNSRCRLRPLDGVGTLRRPQRTPGTVANRQSLADVDQATVGACAGCSSWPSSPFRWAW